MKKGSPPELPPEVLEEVRTKLTALADWLKKLTWEDYSVPRNLQDMVRVLKMMNMGPGMMITLTRDPAFLASFGYCP